MKRITLLLLTLSLPLAAQTLKELESQEASVRQEISAKCSHEHGHEALCYNLAKKQQGLFKQMQEHQELRIIKLR